MNVVVVGLGYVGAVTAACLSKLGHSVVGVDVDPHKLEPLERGVSPIVEPGLEELIATGVESGRLRVSSDLAASAADADVVLVSVGTPARSDGTVDLGFVERVTEDRGVIASRSAFIAILYRSTVPPGTVDGRLRPILEEARAARPTTFSASAWSPSSCARAAASTTSSIRRSRPPGSGTPGRWRS